MTSLSDTKESGLAASSAPTLRRRSSQNNATATMRLSISDAVNTQGKERHEEEKDRQESADKARNQRRKSSLLQMGIANSAIRETASQVLRQEAAGAAEISGVTASPIEKLQALLTRAKEKGMAAERLFEHFAPDGEESVTPAMFETALRKLGQQAFNLDEVELEHLVTTFDTDGNGTIELDEFMTFCLSIPSLPWRAEKARRLGNTESKDDLNVAARRVARRRSSLRAIPIGKLIHEGSRFFWRSKETIDVAFHYNSDEGLVTISTRCTERAYNYPAIFVDAAKIPVSKSEAVSKANSIGQFDSLTEKERVEAIHKATATLRVEYLQHRLKVPDEVNGPEEENEAGSTGSNTSDTSSENEGKAGEGGVGQAAAAAAGVGAGGMEGMKMGVGGMTPKERADDKANHRPFLIKLSTDAWDSLMCERNIVLQTPHRFGTSGRRSSMEDFRRTSLEFEQLAKETEKLSALAEEKAQTVKASIEGI